MALSAYTRRKLAVALGSQSAANALVTIIDAGSGTVSQDSQRRLQEALGSIPEGTALATKIAADSALTDPLEQRMNASMGHTATAEITAVQG